MNPPVIIVTEAWEDAKTAELEKKHPGWKKIPTIVEELARRTILVAHDWEPHTMCTLPGDYDEDGVQNVYLAHNGKPYVSHGVFGDRREYLELTEKQAEEWQGWVHPSVALAMPDFVRVDVYKRDRAEFVYMQDLSGLAKRLAIRFKGSGKWMVRKDAMLPRGVTIEDVDRIY